MSATPFLVRFYSGLLRPNKIRMLGADVAGTVERVGTDVVHFKPGDRVMADAFKNKLGAFAEYTLIHESELVHIPENLGYNEAATIPLAAVTALQGVRDSAEIKPGEEVLIQGAGGGVGFFTVQIAKEFGAQVTAVCGPGSKKMVQSVHPDRIIDYREIDFTSEEKQYDVIIGVNGYHTLGEYKRCLKPEGRYIMIGGNGRGFFDAMILGAISFAGSGKKLKILTIDGSKRTADVAKMAEMAAMGKLRIDIDSVFPPGKAPRGDAVHDEGTYQGEDRYRNWGKIVSIIRPVANSDWCRSNPSRLRLQTSQFRRIGSHGFPINNLV